MSHQPDQHPDARTGAKTMTKAKDNDIHELTCHLQRSVRYHRARERFFEWWSNVFSVVSLLAGSSVVVSLLAAAPAWVAMASGATVAGMQALELVFRLSGRARDHNGFASEFLALERILVEKDVVTEADLRAMKAEILTIEAREPPVKRYLDVICHNQVAVSIGSDDIEKLTPWQRWFAQYLSGDHALQKG